MKYNFVSWSTFYKDIAAWERQLPEFDAVCGVPRSGLPVAAHIGLRRNIRIVDLRSLLENPKTCISEASIRNYNPIVHYQKPYGKRLLIVDDCTGVNSDTLNGLRHQLADVKELEISYAAVYRAASTSKVDFYFRQVSKPRIFEWNWFRHWGLKNACLDMDGVLCEDWTSHPEQENDELFQGHIETVPPLYVPDVPFKAIVTSRLECYREKTEQWLEKHNVKYQTLVMHPAKTPQERRAAGDHAKRKADFYLKSLDSPLFIESDVRQAREIRSISNKPVLCIDTMEMFS